MSKSTWVKQETETNLLSGFVELAAVVFLLLGLVFFWSSRRKEESPTPPAANIAAPISTSTQ